MLGPGHQDTLAFGNNLGWALARLRPEDAEFSQGEAPKVLRASVGTLLKLDLARAEDVSAVLQSGHVLVLPVVRGGADIRQTDVPDRYALVAGNESAGTSIAAEQALSVTIPMAGGVESLNVAAACAVILGRWA